MNPMDAFDSSANSVVAALLNSLWQGTALALFVSLFLRAFRTLNSTTRYAIGCITLAAICGLIPLNVARTFSHRTSPSKNALMATAIQPNSIAPSSVHFEPPSRIGPFEHLEGPRSKSVLVPAITPQTKVPNRTTPSLLITGQWPGRLIELWIFVAALLWSRLGFALWKLTRLQRASELPDAALRERFQTLLAAHAINRPMELRLSATITIPKAVGFFRPFVLLPTAFIETWDRADLDQVLLHEAAHLARRDDWAILGQHLVRSFLWLHPCIHWICRRLSLDRELACDDWVVLATREPKGFARCLLRVAESAQTIRMRDSEFAPGMLRRGAQLSRRVEALLETGQPRSIRLSTPHCLIIVLILSLTIGLAMRTPALVHAEERSLEPHGESSPALETSSDDAVTAQRNVASAIQALRDRFENLVKKQLEIQKAVDDLEEYEARGKGLSVVPMILAGDPAYQALERELALAEAEFADIKKRYKAKHPSYIRCKDKVESLHASMDEASKNGLARLRDRLEVAKVQTQEASLLLKTVLATQKATGVKVSANSQNATDTNVEHGEQASSELDSFIQEIRLAEQQLQLARQDQKAGRGSAENVLKIEREILALKRSMASSQNRNAQHDLIMDLASPSEEELKKTEELREQVSSSLFDTIQQETNSNLRVSALESLILLPGEKTQAILTELALKDKDEYVRQVALFALASNHSIRNTDLLLRIYDQLRPEDTQLQQLIVGRLGSTEGVNSPEERLAIAEKAIAKLREIANKSASRQMRQDAIRQLGSIGRSLERASR